MNRALDPRVYVLLDPLRGPGDPSGTLRATLAGGATAIQVRCPGAGGRELHDATRAVLAVRDEHAPAAAVVVDDRLDVALAAGADGVHLGRHDLPPDAARRIAGPDLSVGWSVTDDADLAVARAAGAVDLLGIGPVFATATKPDAAAPTGLDGLARLRAGVPHTPAVAIGGLDVTTVAAAMAAGVNGICVSSAVGAAADPEQATRALREAVDAALAG